MSLLSGALVIVLQGLEFEQYISAEEVVVADFFRSKFGSLWNTRRLQVDFGALTSHKAVGEMSQ